MISNNRKGMTLIELVLVIALIGIIGSIPVSMFKMGIDTHASTSREFDLQANTRLASQKITNAIRNSSAIFLFPDEADANHLINQFRDDDLFGTGNGMVTLDTALLNMNPNLKKGVDKFKGWSFILLNESKTEVREFKWNITGSDYTIGHYTMTRVVPNQESPKMSYDIEFEKTNSFYEDGIIEFKIVGTQEGNGSPSIEIVSELDSINSLQAIDRGKEASDISTALFFRSDSRPIPDGKEAVIAMVLDESGSMGDNMAGGSGGSSRISILKTQAKDMIDKFASTGLGKTNINIIPFDTSANLRQNTTIYTTFVDVTDNDNRSALKDVIDDLNANGGTNIGDGLRRAYHRLKSYNTTEDNKNKNKYIIFLMDGVPTYGSVHSRDGWFYSETYQGDTYTDEYGRLLIYDDREYSDTYREWYYFYKTHDGKPLYVLNDGNINESNASNYFRFVGGTYGTGSDNYTNRVIGKEYVNQVSALLSNIKNANNYTNVKVFLIGFSGRDGDLDELENIDNIIQANGIATKRWVAKDGGDLEFVFDEIRNIIINETWHIDGPDWTVDTP